MTLVNNASAIQPLLTGDVDVAFPSPTQAIEADNQNFKVQIFTNLVDKIIQQLLVRTDVKIDATPGQFPQAVQALRGKTIGVTVKGGAVDTNLRFLLTAAGMNPDKDVKIVATGGSSALLASIQAKRVDAILAVQPITATLLDKNQAKVLLDLAKGQGPADLNQPFITGMAKKSYIDSHVDTIERLVAALKDTQAFMADPANLSKIVAIAKKDSLPNLSVSIIKQVVQQAAHAASTVCLTADDLQNVSKLLIASGKLKSPADPASVIYPNAMKAAGCQDEP